AAIWFPYAVNPREKVARWSKTTFLELEQLSHDPESGVVMTPLTVLIRREEDAWWKEALPASHIRKARQEELPQGFPLGYRTTVPLAETPRYLPYLQRRFEKAGGLIAIREVKSFNELADKHLH
ncbi:hypothetical protein RZS08_45960, partial [Arthrospira platensis SPKY1]|nr:hypothetical protein [Arthrospira platensis SPKY1]